MKTILILFLCSALFACLAVVDHIRKGPTMTPARKTWMIIAAIFGLVATINSIFF
ncbi:MAG: hypothetical protein OEZ68_16430 [Gammaproteobacteria bacterium]|nr:hypothetical protein [Gammaproteobacteria bacterium]MDH5802389.1 hypothetical protein [Gammaproteobacteria bacterium]